MELPAVEPPEQGSLLTLDDGDGGATGSVFDSAVSKSSGDGGARKGKAPLGALTIADNLPIARVILDLQPAHLDREFDYLVPSKMADGAQPGTRIRARFGGRDVDGFVVARLAESDHSGELQPLRRLVSPEVVLTPSVLELVRAVAARYAGTVADVLRLAVPPRHARAEAALVVEPTETNDALSSCAQSQDLIPAVEPTETPQLGSLSSCAERSGVAGSPRNRPCDSAQGDNWERSEITPRNPWSAYPAGPAFLKHLAAGHAPKAVWTSLPGRAGLAGQEDATPHWATAIAAAAQVAVQAGRGALIVVPDARDVAQVECALQAARVSQGDGVERNERWRLDSETTEAVEVRSTETGSTAGVVRLCAEDGPAARYAAFLAAAREQSQVVVGTRAAMFAPVADLGLIVLWGDGEAALVEPHAPYPHAREVLALRSDLEDAGFLLGSPGRTVEAQALVASRWAREMVATRETVRATAPRVRSLTAAALAAEGPGAGARIPSVAWHVVRESLGRGPVLIQVPRRGYVPAVACSKCRAVAPCAACHGPLALSASDQTPQCRWCGRLAGGWACDQCGSTTLRALARGVDRTAEELGRAFPGFPVRVSSAARGVLNQVSDRPALVVATPGAEPIAAAGYAAALLLDAETSTAGIGLDVEVTALRRWLVAAHLVRSTNDGGQVLLVGDGAPGPTGALVRFDPARFAARTLDERGALALPPATRFAVITGDPHAVAAVVGRVELATEANTLGPTSINPDAVPAPGSLFVPDQVRVLVRVPTTQGDALAQQLHASLAVRSARRETGKVKVQLDPDELA